ncbi:MAG: O-antigen ligase family protein [Lachnospiraceae bacterium]|nr:O-antigen ligase family protein [Lachnospiraceae bacterium]
MAQSKKKNNAGVKPASGHARHNKIKEIRFGNDSLWFKFLTLAPLAAILGIVPLLVRCYAYDTGLKYYDFYWAYEPDGVTFDFFLHCKMVAFLVFSFILACILIARLIVEKKKIKFTKIFIPLGVYALLALLSSIFSKYQPYPWTGVFEQFESVFVLLGSVVSAYYAFLFVNDKKDIAILIGALTIGTLVMIPIGITQAFFTDIYQSEFGYKFVVPDKYKSVLLLENLKFTFEKGRVYLSLYNPNYVGSYAALLSPVFLMMIFAAKNILLKLLYAAMYVGLLLALFASSSRAGFIGIGLSLVLLVILFARWNWRFWVAIVLFAAITVGAFSFYLKKTGNMYLVNRLKAAFDVAEKTEPDALSSIETNDEDVVLTWHENRLHLQFDPGNIGFYCFDDEGNALDTEIDYENAIVTITDPRFSGITLTPTYLTEDKDILGFTVRAWRDWTFANYGGTYYYFTPYGKLIKYQNSESSEWLDKHPRLASGRGYIWSKTVPLLKDNIFLGTGADTFIFAFPQTDFRSIIYGGYYGQFITKPHNMYLQTGVQTGMLSLVAMLVFYLWYLGVCLVTSIKLKKHNFYSYISGGIAAGTFGYMITGLINDSTITVAPLYWALLGIGLASCFLAKKEDAEALTAPLGSEIK